MPTSARRSARRLLFGMINRIHGSPSYSTSSQLSGTMLMIPVGGFYTIDALQAKAIAEELNARTILPMHYKTRYNADWPISGPEAFLDLYDKADIREGGEILRVTRGDRSCQPKVFLFEQK